LPQILAEADLYVFIDLIESATGVAETKVVPPAFQVPIQVSDQGRNRRAPSRTAGQIEGERVSGEKGCQEHVKKLI